VVPAPLRANIDAATTGGLYQYVPAGYFDLPPTPGCEEEPEGHFCADSNPPALRQRVHFFESALGGGPPEIIDPLAE
jgi:hypothetical protein